MPPLWQQGCVLALTIGCIAMFVQVSYLNQTVPTLVNSYLKKSWIVKCQSIYLEWQTWIQKVWNAGEQLEQQNASPAQTFETLKEFATSHEGHYGTSPEPRWVRPDHVRNLKPFQT